MAVSLPMSNLAWPALRVLVRRTFGAGGIGSDQSVSGSDWQVLPMQRKGQRAHGLEVVSFSRGALPYIGRAILKLEYGNFADGFIGADSTTTAQLSAGSAWDPVGDATNVYDLRGWIVRIQAAAQTTDNSTPAWQTVWLGTCEYQQDDGAPGAAIPMGTRTFHCVDLLQLAGRWLMDRHFLDASWSGRGSVRYANAVGPLGYNTPPTHAASDVRIAGNRSASRSVTEGSAQIDVHTHAGLGTSWSAQQAAEHALALSRPAGEPLFAFRGYGGNAAILNLLAGAFAWPVRETDTALEVVTRIVKRERGRGVTFLDFTDTGGPSGPVQVYLTVAPQLTADVSYVSNFTSGATTTLLGATNAGTTTTVDLIGDHRAIKDSFAVSDPYQRTLDRLEVLGEPIEVAATLSYKDNPWPTTNSYYVSESLAPRWTLAEQTSFRSATTIQRSLAQHKAVYQAHSLPPNWLGYAGDGNGGSLTRVDYRCSDTGAILVPDATDVTTSPALVQLLSDMPLFNGWNYGVNPPVRFDAASGDPTPPSRRPLFGGVWVSAGRFLRFDETSVSVSIRRDQANELWLTSSGDEDAGTRALSDVSLSGAGAAYNYQNLWVTVGLRLPHRVRFAFGDPNGRRRSRVIFQDFHLWLGAPGCIYDVDVATGSASAGWAVKRGPAGATTSSPGILRDDRVALSQIAAQLWAWSGATATTRRTATWQLRDCGVLPSFTTSTGATVTYPKLGQTVTTLSANGEALAVNTPCTLVEYDNQRGVTTWSTDWCELDLSEIWPLTPPPTSAAAWRLRPARCGTVWTLALSRTRTRLAKLPVR